MSDERVLIISSDGHAGALPSIYNEYMPAKYHDAANQWWVDYTREMMSRVGTFFDQEAVEAYAEKAGQGGELMKAHRETFHDFAEEDIRAILGGNAARVYGFDVDALSKIAQEIGPSIAQIRGEA